MSVWNDSEFVVAWNRTYGLSMENMPGKQDLIFSWLAEEIGLFENKLLLDLGCGNGNLIRYFRDRAFARWQGIDKSQALLHSARQDLESDKRIEFTCGDIGQCLNAVDFFDIVTSLFVLEELPQEAMSGYWKNMRDALKPEGKAYIVCNHPVKAHSFDLTAHLLLAENEKFPKHQGYFDRKPTVYTLDILNQKQGEGKRPEYHHKTMADILNSASQSGLHLCQLQEIPAGVRTLEQWKKHVPRSGDRLSALFLVFSKE